MPILASTTEDIERAIREADDWRRAGEARCPVVLVPPGARAMKAALNVLARHGGTLYGPTYDVLDDAARVFLETCGRRPTRRWGYFRALGEERPDLIGPIKAWVRQGWPAGAAVRALCEATGEDPPKLQMRSGDDPVVLATHRMLCGESGDDLGAELAIVVGPVDFVDRSTYRVQQLRRCLRRARTAELEAWRAPRRPLIQLLLELVSLAPSVREPTKAEEIYGFHLNADELKALLDQVGGRKRLLDVSMMLSPSVVGSGGAPDALIGAAGVTGAWALAARLSNPGSLVVVPHDSAVALALDGGAPPPPPPGEEVKRGGWGAARWPRRDLDQLLIAFCASLLGGDANVLVGPPAEGDETRPWKTRLGLSVVVRSKGVKLTVRCPWGDTLPPKTSVIVLATDPSFGEISLESERLWMPLVAAHTAAFAPREVKVFRPSASTPIDHTATRLVRAEVSKDEMSLRYLVQRHPNGRPWTCHASWTGKRLAVLRRDVPRQIERVLDATLARSLEHLGENSRLLMVVPGLIEPLMSLAVYLARCFHEDHDVSPGFLEAAEKHGVRRIVDQLATALKEHRLSDIRVRAYSRTRDIAADQDYDALLLMRHHLSLGELREDARVLGVDGFAHWRACSEVDQLAWIERTGRRDADWERLRLVIWVDPEPHHEDRREQRLAWAVNGIETVRLTHPGPGCPPGMAAAAASRAARHLIEQHGCVCGPLLDWVRRNFPLYSRAFGRNDELKQWLEEAVGGKANGAAARALSRAAHREAEVAEILHPLHTHVVPATGGIQDLGQRNGAARWTLFATTPDAWNRFVEALQDASKTANRET